MRPSLHLLPIFHALHSNLRLQFALFSAVVMVLGMVGTGFWLTSQVEDVVTGQAGAVTALYVDAIIAPVTQTLREAEELSEEAREALGHLLESGALGDEISAFKLWSMDNRVTYSTRPDLIGQVATNNLRLSKAQNGIVHAELRPLPSWLPGVGDDGGPQMEVYTPIWSEGSGEVLAVAEFYTRAAPLMSHLLTLRLKGWAIVGAVFVTMFVILYGFFARGSRTIDSQRRQLDEKISELSGLLEANEALTESVNLANLRIADINEKNLRRLSAELHDGPAQLLAFAALRLDGAADLGPVQQAVDDALKEMRLICRGLVLPELETWSVPTIAQRLVSAHEERHQDAIILDLPADFPQLSITSKNCIYRFIQEALNNAARHAGASKKTLRAFHNANGVSVELDDDGPGFDLTRPHDGLGLAGLRERIHGLSGKFILETQPGKGTRVRLWLPLAEQQD